MKFNVAWNLQNLSPFTEVPISSPVIHGIKSRYKVNDIIRGNCTSKYSRPAANLTWTINDIIVSENILAFFSRLGGKVLRPFWGWKVF